MAKKSRNKHQCFDLLADELKEHNAELVGYMHMNFKTGKGNVEHGFHLRKVDSKNRKRLPTILFTYCPICGMKLPQEIPNG